MELRVEATPGYTLPPGCFVGVRLGDVLKQGRYEPQRCYHFPTIDRRRNAKIDIYKHVGSCVLGVDPDGKSENKVSVSPSDPTVPAMSLTVNVKAGTGAPGVDVGQQQREEKAQAVKSQAKDYLVQYGIEEKLSLAVKALLKEQPSDPTEFLCRHLKGDPFSASPGQTGVPAQLRTQVADILVAATKDGGLQAALEELPPVGQTSPAFQPESRSPCILSTNMMIGPSFYSMGMPMIPRVF